MKAKVNKLKGNCKKKNIRKIYKGISEFTNGSQTPA